MQMFSEALSRFGRELTKPYIYLIPESSFSKLLSALRQSVMNGFWESLVVFVPAGLILGLDLWDHCRAGAGPLVVHAGLQCRHGGGNAAVCGVSSKFLTMFFYVLLMLLIALPGAAAAIALGAMGYPEALCYAALAVLNVPMALLALFLCRNMLQCAELNEG